MKKFRKSLFLKSLCYVMAFSIFFISCDPNGSELVDDQIENQAEIILNKYSDQLSEKDCENFSEIVNATKAYVWLIRQGGTSPSQQDVAKFVYDQHVKKGMIKHNEKERDGFATIVSSNAFMGDHTTLIQNLEEEGTYSEQMANITQSFADDFTNVKTFEEGYDLINEYRNSELILELNENEQLAWLKAMDTADQGICYEQENHDSIESSRGLCEECIWELNWVKAIIAAVVTVAVWIFAVVTLGWGTLLASVVTLAVWTAIWVLHCFWVECESSDPCPEGQEPFCEVGFVLNLDEGVCELDDIYQNPTINSDNCIKVDKLPNGDCPGESMAIPGLTQCILICFGAETPEGFGQQQGGTFVYPYVCQ